LTFGDPFLDSGVVVVGGRVRHAVARRDMPLCNVIKSPFSGLCFVLALAGIQRLVVQMKSIEMDDFAPLQGAVCSGARRHAGANPPRRLSEPLGALSLAAGSSNSRGARPVHLIITMIKWTRTSRLLIQKSRSNDLTPGDGSWTSQNATCATRRFLPG